MRQLLGGVRRRRWILALGGAVGAVAGWLVSDGSEATTDSRIAATAVGLVAGMLAVLVLSMIWHAITRRLDDRSSVEAVFGRPVLAEIPDLEDEFGPPRSLLGGLAAADRRLVEPFELLRLSLVDPLHPFNPETGADEPRGIVILVSPTSSEVSVAATAENLGATLAENGHNVLLIDGDLRSPTLSAELALNSRGRGLLDASASGPLLASGSFDLDHVVEPTEHELVSVVGFGAGQGVDQPGRVMSRVGPFFNAARVRYGAIVIAGPVPTVAGGGIELAALADRHVLAAKTGVTTSSDAGRVMALLGQLGLSVDGVILGGRSPNALRLRRKRRRLERQAPRSVAPIAPIAPADTVETPARQDDAAPTDDRLQPEAATEVDASAELDEFQEVAVASAEARFGEAEADDAGVIPDDVTGGTLDVRNWFDPIHSDTPPPESLFTTGDLAEMGPSANGGDPDGDVRDDDEVDYSVGVDDDLTPEGRAVTDEAVEDGPLDDQLELLDHAVLEELGTLETADLGELAVPDVDDVESSPNGDVIEGSDRGHGLDGESDDIAGDRNETAVDHETNGVDDRLPGAGIIAGDDPIEAEAETDPVRDVELVDEEAAQPTASHEVVIAGSPPLPGDAPLQPEPDDEPARSKDLAGLNLDLLDGLEDEDELNTTRP